MASTRHTINSCLRTTDPRSQWLRTNWWDCWALILWWSGTISLSNMKPCLTYSAISFLSRKSCLGALNCHQTQTPTRWQPALHQLALWAKRLPSNNPCQRELDQWCNRRRPRQLWLWVNRTQRIGLVMQLKVWMSQGWTRMMLLKRSSLRGIKTAQIRKMLWRKWKTMKSLMMTGTLRMTKAAQAISKCPQRMQSSSQFNSSCLQWVLSEIDLQRLFQGQKITLQAQ
jgi:hypothetical protein